MDRLLEVSLSQGLGYALFVFLFLYVLKTQEKRDKKSEEREEKYQNIISENQDIIEKLTEKLNIIEDIKVDVKDIKDRFLK